MPSTSVTPYPWHALESLSRANVLAERVLLAALPQNSSLEGLAQGLASLLGSEVSFIFQRFCEPRHAIEAPDALHFELSEQHLKVSVWMEGQLADELLSLLLKHARGLSGVGPLLDAGLRGMLTRVLTEAARRTNPPLCLSPLLAPAPSTGYTQVGVRLTVILEGRPYDVRASFICQQAAAITQPRASLATLGTLPLKVSLAAAEVLIASRVLRTLRVGDALLVGSGSTLAADLRGTLWLGAHESQCGVFFEIVDQRNVKLSHVREMKSLEETVMSNSPDPDTAEGIAEAVLDAPVVVRVEVASVTLAAEALANLRPGDVITTDQPIGQLSTLRVAGREIARGELVNIEGELGVRIRKLAGRS